MHCCRALFGLVVLVAVAGCSGQVANEGSAVSAATNSQPNILILFADDLGYGDLASYGHPNIATPNLDALAAGGQRWTDFYVAAPVCSPSRGALLTGRLPNRTGLYGTRLPVLFPEDEHGMPAAEVTIAELLSAEGYATALIGKWHLGDAPEVYPTRHGFDYWYGLPYSNDMDWVGSFTFADRIARVMQGKELTPTQQAEVDARPAMYQNPKVEFWNVPLIRSRKVPASGTAIARPSTPSNISSNTEITYEDEIIERPAQQPTLTQRYTDEALAFIDRHPNQPFFVYMPYTMPHTPLFASTHYQGTSRGGTYGDVIEEIDGSVGQMMAGLKERGLTEHTLVIFTSDNGPWLIMQQMGGSAGLLKMGKGTTFEGGVRVPAIFSQPGTVQPGVVHQIGSTLDLLPTVLALANMERPANSTLDGVDLSQQLTNPQPQAPARTNMPYYRAGELRAWRQGNWKLHLIVEGAYGVGPKREVLENPQLFHLGNDPAERFDVAAANPEVVANIEAAINAHQKRLETQPPIFDARLIPKQSQH